MELHAELSPAGIAMLVDRFYDKVRADPLLGPVFEPAVHDWAEHKRTLVAFWSSVVLRSGDYRGNPMRAHLAHPIRAEHFDRWLALWRETTGEVFVPEAAEIFRDYAARIAQGLSLGLGLKSPGRGRALGIPVRGA